MNRPVIGVIAASYEDFRAYIDPLIDRSQKPDRDTRRMYRTPNIWYHAVVSPLNTHSITFSDVVVTESAYLNKEILDILLLVKASLFALPLERRLEVIEMFDKLETDYKNNL